MEYFTGGNPQAAIFAIGNSRFTIPAETMGKAEVQASGLVRVLRKEGFKDIPPMVPRTEDGAYQIDRPQLGFELMVEHLLGVEPLRGCRMSEFAEKYIALKTELLFWQIPTLDVAFDDHLFYSSAWTDGDCFFPFHGEDLAAFHREDLQEELPANLLRLSSASIPAELEGLLDGPQSDFQCFASPAAAQQGEAAAATTAAASNRIFIVAGKEKFFCLVPGMQRPCVHFASLPDRSGFTPCALVAGPSEVTLIWSKGAFVHVHGFQKKQGEMRFQVDLLLKEPAWLCVHPTLGAVLSGVEGPVPHVFCFAMPKAEVVRFFPWGALAINGEVVCEPPAKRSENKEEPEAHSRGLLDSLGISAMAPGLSAPKPALAATLLRFLNKSFQPPARICFVNIDKQAETVKLQRVKDFDIHDLRTEDSIGFRILAALKGALAETRTDNLVPEQLKGGKTLLFPINNKLEFAKDSQILIDNGGPQGQELLSIALYGEYNCSTGNYCTFEIGKRLYEFHKKMFLARSMSSGGGCNVM